MSSPPLYAFWNAAWGSAVHGKAIFWPSSRLGGVGFDCVVCSRFNSTPPSLYDIFIVSLLSLEHAVYRPEKMSSGSYFCLLWSRSFRYSFTGNRNGWILPDHHVYLNALNKQVLQERIALCYVALPFHVSGLVYPGNHGVAGECVVLAGEEWETD